MNSYQIYTYKTDLFLEKDKHKIDSNIKVLEFYKDNYTYKTIFFNSLINVKDTLKSEINNFFIKYNIKKGAHIFIVGLGNENLCADSIGPKALKNINVNSYIKDNKDTKVSALEPGVLSKTGILTEKIISSVKEEIKPDIAILIDSFISDDVNYLNKTIEINDKGIVTGSGIKGINSEISFDTLNIPVIIIGVTTAIEFKLTNDNKNFVPYLLTSKNIDDYVDKVSLIISSSINESIADLK